MTDLERLIAIEDIKQLMARRCRALDAKDWTTYAACHAPDHLSHGTLGPGAIGGAALIEALAKRLEGVATVHHVHNPEIEFLSASEARGVWPMEDRLFWKEGDEEHWMRGWGHYHDSYGKRDGRWLFTSRRLTRVRVDYSPGSKRPRE